MAPMSYRPEVRVATSRTLSMSPRFAPWLASEAAELLRLVQAFEGRRVLVLGDLVADEYVLRQARARSPARRPS